MADLLLGRTPDTSADVTVATDDLVTQGMVRRLSERRLTAVPDSIVDNPVLGRFQLEQSLLRLLLELEPRADEVNQFVRSHG